MNGTLECEPLTYINEINKRALPLGKILSGESVASFRDLISGLEVIGESGITGLKPLTRLGRWRRTADVVRTPSVMTPGKPHTYVGIALREIGLVPDDLWKLGYTPSMSTEQENREGVLGLQLKLDPLQVWEMGINPDTRCNYLLSLVHRGNNPNARLFAVDPRDESNVQLDLGTLSQGNLDYLGVQANNIVEDAATVVQFLLSADR